VILFLCGAHFIFWYGVQLASSQEFARDLEPYETWDEVNHGDPDGRIGVNRQLAQMPGKQLVFVRYWPKHTVTEWVYNGADIDHQAVVFARDMGAEDETLRSYYPDRTALILEPDANPPKLSPYQKPGLPEPVTLQIAEPKPSAPPTRPKLHFEEVK
jgi:hypothetical protein